MEYINKVFFKDAQNMEEIPNESIDLVVTSPPYFNVKDYSLDGYQEKYNGDRVQGQIGDINDYEKYIASMLPIWIECERVLKPNGKLAINTPLMPMLRKSYSTHYNRHIFNINNDIEHSILSNIRNIFLLDIYIWNRTNTSKRLMFGSYPYPRNFYAQNTVEFINVFVKDGAPHNKIDKDIKERSRLSQKEWVEYTQQVWNIPIPNKKDVAFGHHPAIMPEEIVKRTVKLFTFVEDTVLDPFAGSGTTLKVAKALNRNYVGYEISESYKDIINLKLQTEDTLFHHA